MRDQIRKAIIVMIRIHPMHQLSLNAKQSMTRGSMDCQGKMVSLLTGLDTRRMKTVSM